MWTCESQENSRTNLGLEEMACLKRSEPKLSFCKCLVFQSDLVSHFNKFGNAIDWTKIDRNISLTELSSESRLNNFCVTVPYDSKEVTTFSVESRKKITVIDVTKDSTEKLSDIVMCMKLVEINTQVFLIICTEEGHLSLYNMKFKRKECQVKLKTDVKVNKKRGPISSKEKQESVENDLGLNMADTPMAIDFDPRTLRGIIGTNSSNLYCIKLYLENSKSRDSSSIPPTNITSENQNSDGTTLSDTSQLGKSISSAHLKIKMVLELKHSGVSCISIKPDGKLFVLSFWDGNGIYIYNWSNMKCVSYIDYVYKTIHDLHFYSNNMLTVACDGGKVSLWSFPS